MTTSLWTTVVIVTLLIFRIKAEGNVGCLLSKQVCDGDEWCYDDFAFGHCMPSYDTITIDDLYRYELETDALKQLEHEFRRLFTAGYRWTHSYTQCIVKHMLYSFRHKTEFERKKCDSNQDEDLERALKFLEAKDVIDPKDVALIKFEPSLIDPSSEYGDELFIPSKDMYSHLQKQDDDSLLGTVKPSQIVDAGANKIKRKKKVGSDNKFNLALLDENLKLNRRLTEEEFLQLLGIIDRYGGDIVLPEVIDYPSVFTEMENPEEKSIWSFTKRKGRYDKPAAASTGSTTLNKNYEFDEDKDAYFPENVPSLDSSFIFDRSHRYDVKKPGPFFKVNNYIFDKEKSDDQTSSPQETHIFQYHPMFEEQDLSQSTFRHLHQNQPPVELTADGMDHTKPNLNDKNASDYKIDALKRLDMKGQKEWSNYPYYDYIDPSLSDDFSVDEEESDSGLSDLLFDRGREEVDLDDGLKAPLHFPNRFAMKSHRRSNTLNKLADDWSYRTHRADFNNWMNSDPVRHTNVKYLQEPGALKSAVIVNKSPQKNGTNNIGEAEKRILSFKVNEVPSVEYVKPPDGHQMEIEPTITDDLEIVDASYAYIIVNKEFADWREGKNYAKKLETLLHLPPGTFSNIRQEGNQITFKVNSNLDGMTASDVARKAENLKDELQKITGKLLKSSGIGNKIHLTVHELSNSSQVVIITFIVCGVIAGLVLGVGVLYLILHHSRSKQKLQDITQVETEASQDYQELCRQRMAIKSSEKPEPIQVLAAQRISGLSRESETSVHSPSSRSSTSSWNEEPIAFNMDISTGHMVLSYMEDHLTNKDRLDKEWEALCRYEADPSFCNVASQPNNLQKNRYPHILPYDHSRVVLNEFCNGAGCDFINANTITDHDPRNAAYIATQGPLPHTSADFWQMIWEQGSVVIVMLSRLVENGVAMCHRYWPEEGSELYHIYEVHLVSEHIWCEDYLIRNFYLKNLKTGETRTVTQFHFLSWPDMGVPVSAKMILDFRRKVNKSYRGRSCPIVVHCSDGCGRTGTYCLIDMVLNRMAKGLKEIDIAATLEHIRDQRMGMVQTKDQFQFVLMAVAEEVHSILKTIP